MLELPNPRSDAIAGWVLIIYPLNCRIVHKEVCILNKIGLPKTWSILLSSQSISVLIATISPRLVPAMSG